MNPIPNISSMNSTTSPNFPSITPSNPLTTDLMVASAQAKPKNAVERSSIPTLETIPPVLNLNLANFFSGNCKEEKIPISELGIDKKTHETLKKVFDSTQFGRNSPLLINLCSAYYQEFLTLKNVQTASIQSEMLKEVLENVQHILNAYTYYNFTILLKSPEKKENVDDIHEQLLTSIQLIRPVAHSPQFQQEIFKRFPKNFAIQQKKFLKIIEKHTSEMENMAHSIHALCTLPCDKFKYVNAISFNEFMDATTKTSLYINDFINFKNFITQIADHAVSQLNFNFYLPLCSVPFISTTLENMLKLLSTNYLKKRRFFQSVLLNRKIFR